MKEALRTALGDSLRPGTRIALADGVGTPRELLEALGPLAAEVGGIELLMGWTPSTNPLDLSPFARVSTIMGGYGLRRSVESGEIVYIPVRLGAVPSLLRDVLRPDVVLVSVRRVDGRLHLTTEDGWISTAMEVATTVIALEREASPVAGVAVPTGIEITVIGESDRPPDEVVWGEPLEVHRAIAERLVRLVPAGARVQYGPGFVGTAFLEAIRHPVCIDTGIITDPIVGLAERGLLAGVASAPYLAGLPALYDWAHGRTMIDRLEWTHDPSRLGSGLPFVSVNTAIEIDVDGQVNVEAAHSAKIAGVGGHPDFAFAAARSVGGLSIVAVPILRGTHPTLVDTLSAPVSTASHDVDVVVTENGSADLRGLGRDERRRAIERLWNR